MVAVIPFANESAADIGSYAKLRKIEFPIVKDSDGMLAKQLTLHATPEVFLFDRRGRLAYRGAIDDALYFMMSPKKHYLADAMEAVFQGRKPAVAFKEPWGCAHYKEDGKPVAL